jgi:hypothetical protein
MPWYLQWDSLAVTEDIPVVVDNLVTLVVMDTSVVAAHTVTLAVAAILEPLVATDHVVILDLLDLGLLVAAALMVIQDMPVVEAWDTQDQLAQQVFRDMPEVLEIPVMLVIWVVVDY